MTTSDPTASETNTVVAYDGDLSLETVQQIQFYEAAATNGASKMHSVGTNGAGDTVITVGVGDQIGTEPTSLPQDAVAAPPSGILQPPVLPIPILPKRLVRGRYRSTTGSFQVELRVDVDGSRPTRRVSADYYVISGATVTYFGSMIVDAVTVAVTSTQVTITGLGRYTWAAGAPMVRVTIPRTTIFVPPAAATLQHFTSGGGAGATYVCAYQSAYFRTVDIEEDYEQGITRFASYNTGSLPSGGAGRTLSVVAAYTEAGIEMRLGPNTDIVQPIEAGNSVWSNAELHHAMERHFSLYADRPQWRVWLFHALKHDIGPGLLGIMFDQQGRQRQGAAVFYQSQNGTSATALRNQLYCCVHELGHCFNLFHSFHKQYMTPPQPNRPAALSYMNYPQNYTGGAGGAAAFWAAFPFQFDDLELIHLRHAFRDNIIFGGSNFGIGAALEHPQEWLRNPIVDNSGLQLTLSAPSNFPLGAPVSVELTLHATDSRGRMVHSRLKPANGFVEIAIIKPNEKVALYRPPLHECVIDEPVMLGRDRSLITESAYIGYGKDGMYFDQEGFYRIRAVYYSIDGSIVLSNIIKLRIDNPLNRDDQMVADLLIGEEQGLLFYLMGSDGLAAGNKAFDEVLDRYGKHSLANCVRLVKGINAAREFKTITHDKEITVRSPDTAQAQSLLKPLGYDPSAPQVAAMRADAKSTDEISAARAMTESSFNESKQSPYLREFIMAQSAEIRAELAP